MGGREFIGGRHLRKGTRRERRAGSFLAYLRMADLKREDDRRRPGNAPCRYRRSKGSGKDRVVVFRFEVTASSRRTTSTKTVSWLDEPPIDSAWLTDASARCLTRCAKGPRHRPSRWTWRGETQPSRRVLRGWGHYGRAWGVHAERRSRNGGDDSCAWLPAPVVGFLDLSDRFGDEGSRQRYVEARRAFSRARTWSMSHDSVDDRGVGQGIGGAWGQSRCPGRGVPDRRNPTTSRLLSVPQWRLSDPEPGSLASTGRGRGRDREAVEPWSGDRDVYEALASWATTPR